MSDPNKQFQILQILSEKTKSELMFLTIDAIGILEKFVDDSPCIIEFEFCHQHGFDHPCPVKDAKAFLLKISGGENGL